MSDKVQLIKEEIERRIKETESMQPKFDQFWAGQISAFKGVMKIIDSLPKEPSSEDLKEASTFYTNTHTEYFDSEGNPHVAVAFKAGAEWQEKKMLGIAEAFYQQGRYEQEQEMMKDAVEGEYWIGEIHLDTPIIQGYDDGDRIKFIPIKTEQ